MSIITRILMDTTARSIFQCKIKFMRTENLEHELSEEVDSNRYRLKYKAAARPLCRFHG